jgi:hypothetical protein
MIAFNAEGGSGGGDGGAADGAAASSSPETLLFPGDGAEGGDKPSTDATAGKVDWKEYVNDPAKSEADNASAKAQHDETKPAADAKDDAAKQVPADGKYSLVMPEGVAVDQQLLDAIGPDFKELGLTNEQAQKLADKFIKLQGERSAGQMKGWGETVSGWADQAKSDKEIGGDKWDATVKDATRFIRTYETPALKDYLNASGGGNHPELIRIFAKAGALIREDNVPAGGAGGASKPVDPAHVLFANDVPKG